MKDLLEGLDLGKLNRSDRLFMILCHTLVQKGLLKESDIGDMIDRAKQYD